jgi:hypothetical protein
MTTPGKKAEISTEVSAQDAKNNFWQVLHQGQYDEVPEAIRMLTFAYIQNPNDAELAAFLGFAHIWQVAERSRHPELDPTIINEIILARRFFKDAKSLSLDDARLLGFYGVATLAEGKIMNNDHEQVKGYFILRKAITKWPEFNYFTAGYPMSILPKDSEKFQQGLEWQWATLDRCAGTKIDRKNPTYASYMNLATKEGPKRACWNSWIAPYNFEGFFLNMGDMLVKNGQWQTAIKIYQNAQLADNYSTWPYREILEDRIKNAKEYVTIFNEEMSLSQTPKEPTMMFNSHFACMACHQNG